MVPGSAGCLKWDSLSHIWENTCVFFLNNCVSPKKREKKMFNLFVPSLYNFQTTNPLGWRSHHRGTHTDTLALSHSDAPLVQDASTARPTDSRLRTRHFVVPHTWKLFVSETNKRFTNVFWVSFTKLKSFANLHNFSYHNWSETKSKTLKQITYPI